LDKLGDRTAALIELVTDIVPEQSLRRRILAASAMMTVGPPALEGTDEPAGIISTSVGPERVFMVVPAAAQEVAEPPEGKS